MKLKPGSRSSKVGARSISNELTLPLVSGVQITTPKRPVYPKLGFTKLDLAAYYASIAPWTLAYVKHRPLTFVRCERGATREDALRTECKFLRHEPGWHRWAPPSLQRLKIKEQKKVGEYLIVDSVEGLVELAQGDILELHCWNAAAAHLEQPDRFIFDLDPAPNVTWKEVVQAAISVRARLSDMGLESWPKLTGGKGVHVVVPFEPELDWDSVYTITRILAEALVRETPQQFTAQFEKKRRAGKILIDYKRNHRAAVAVAAYSPRAFPDGSVSAPLKWSELKRIASPRAYTVQNIVQRLRRLKTDPWADFWACRQSLPSALRRFSARGA